MIKHVFLIHIIIITINSLQLRANGYSGSERALCSPSPITIVVDSGLEPATPKKMGHESKGVEDEEELGEQQRLIDEAWRNTVAARVTEGSAIYVHNGAEDITEALVAKIVALCHERLIF